MAEFIMESFSKQIRDIVSTYGNDNIFILGKGVSADSIEKDILSTSVVIGINDAERICPVDITIFHEEWVKKGLSSDGYRSMLYVTSTDFQPENGDVVSAPYLPMKSDMADLMMQRLQSDDFAIEEVLFVSALKIARMISKLRGRPQKVFMLGFDFLSGGEYAREIDVDYSGAVADERYARISPQEFYFVNTLYVLNNSELDVIHVGRRSFSHMTPEEFNKEFSSARDVSGGVVGTSGSVLVVAELTTNHFGDRHRLERMIRAAKAAGANYVKLQKRDVETFYSEEQLSAPYVSPFGSTFRDYRHALELSREDFEFVDTLCKKIGIRWFASILDEPSFRFMMDLNPEMVKLPSTISEHKDYLAFVANNYRGSIVLSTGMTDSDYERWVLDTFTSCKELYLLQCNSAYPTPLHDCGVGVVRRYRDISMNHPRIIPGYSSHDFGWMASALAVASGARMVEKHVKLGNTEWAHFDAVAMDLTKDEFREYVLKIRESELIVGDEKKTINDSEHHKYFRA